MTIEQLEDFTRFICPTSRCPFQPLLSLLCLVQVVVKPARATHDVAGRVNSSVHSHDVGKLKCIGSHPRTVEMSFGEKALMQECALQHV